jgi:hypothetical protein
MNLNNIFGLNKQVKRHPMGNVHSHMMNLQQLYQHHFLNSHDAKARASALIAMHNLCLDMAEVCLHTEAEPEKEIYKQLESGQ